MTDHHHYHGAINGQVIINPEPAPVVIEKRVDCPTCAAARIAKRSGETFARAIERGLTATAHRVAKSDAEFTVELHKVMDDPSAMNAWQIAGFEEARRLPMLEARRALEKRFAGDAEWLAALRDAYIVASR